MKTPLTPERLKEHLRYSWWKYVLLVALTIGFWNIFFAVTAYRPPKDRKLTILIYGSGDYEAAQVWLDSVREAHFPGQELFTADFVMKDETYGTLALNTRLIAGDIDLLLVPREEMLSMAEGGFLMPLEDKEGIQDLCGAAGADTSRGWRRDTAAGERHLLWIPAGGLPRLKSWLYVDSSDYCLAVQIASGNRENALELLREILRDAAASRPAEPAQENP